MHEAGQGDGAAHKAHGWWGQAGLKAGCRTFGGAKHHEVHDRARRGHPDPEDADARGHRVCDVHREEPPLLDRHAFNAGPGDDGCRRCEGHAGGGTETRSSEDGGRTGSFHLASHLHQQERDAAGRRQESDCRLNESRRHPYDARNRARHAPAGDCGQAHRRHGVEGDGDLLGGCHHLEAGRTRQAQRDHDVPDPDHRHPCEADVDVPDRDHGRHCEADVDVPDRDHGRHCEADVDHPARIACGRADVRPLLHRDAGFDDRHQGEDDPPERVEVGEVR